MPPSEVVSKSREWELLSEFSNQIRRIHLLFPKDPEIDDLFDFTIHCLSCRLDLVLVMPVKIILHAVDAGSLQASDANSQLKDLCTILDHHVDPKYVDAENQATSEPYTNLAHLIRHLKSQPSQVEFDIIVERAIPSNILFIVSSKPRFVDAFRDSMKFRTPIPDDIKFEMVEEMENTTTIITRFTDFIQGLHEIHSLPAILPLPMPPREPTSTNSSTRTQFMELLSSSLKTIFSGFSKCQHIGRMKHQVLFQIPSWDQLTSKTGPSAAKFILDSCPQDVSWHWQHVEALPTPVRGSTRSESFSLCEAMHTRSDNGKLVLQLVAHEVETHSESGSVQVLLPTRPKRNGPRPENTLSDLINDGSFERQTSLEYYSIHKRGVFTLAERKDLVKQLFIGFMISMELDYSIDVWDTKNIFFPHLTADRNHTPYVICSLLDTGSRTFREILNQNQPEKPDTAKLEEVFVNIAKLLVELSIGDSWESIISVIGTDESDISGIIWSLERYIGIDDPQNSMDTALLLDAARACLQFQSIYAKRITESESNRQKQGIVAQQTDVIAIATRLIHDNILCKIQRLPREDLKFTKEIPFDIHSSRNHSGLVEREITPEAELIFQSQTTHPKNIQSAQSFFNRYNSFLKSCQDSIVEEPSQRVRIAIPDTGIDTSHPGIQAAAASGRIKDWCDRIDQDEEKHGTQRATLLHMFAPSFHVCPDFHIEPPPYGHLNLGSILSGLDAGSVRAPLNRRSVIPVMDTYKYPKSGPYRKDGWSLSLSQLQSIEGGIWARIFTSKGAGAGLEFHQAPSGEDILTVEHTFVQYFFPTEEYMKRSLEIDGVDCFVSVSRKKLPLYMVTGLMWAVGANWSHVSRKERTFKGEAGYGGEDSLSTTFGRSKPLLLGIRVRKIWWDKSRKTKKNDDVVGRTCRSNQIRSEQLNDGLIWQDDFTVDENAEPSVLDKVIVDESKLMSEDPIVWVLD